MNELRIPEQLKGRWNHALFLTYGVDATYFENALWQQFKNRCPNKIILADGAHYLEAAANYARSGLIRYMNTRYVVDGIFCPQAAHAKLILLTNAKQGRLLVGSGNLNMQGYASGGELFTKYDYSPNEPTSLGAFCTVRQFVTRLLTDNYVQGTARRYIRHLFEQTPWIYHQPPTNDSPVCHNLDSSFFDQLNAAINGEQVEALWILSPFYDKALKALRRMLTIWQPQQTTLLVQPALTSIDPNELQQVMVGENGRCHVRAISKGGDGRYIHAKMYLLKLRNRAICLQGSPNLSQVAMLRTVPQGNIELANIQIGARDSFDHIFDALTIDPPTTQLTTLNLTFVGGKDDDAQIEEVSTTCQLLGGEWIDNQLLLRYRGHLPDLTTATLTIAELPIQFRLVDQQKGWLELDIAPEASDLLQSPVPIRLQWGTEEEPIETNAVFVCHRAALDAALDAAGDAQTLEKVGRLDLESDEIELLLGELENALVLDRRDILQVAGRSTPEETAADDDATPLSYEEIDYEAIRQHPRLQQYLERGDGQPQQYGRSRLQIILSAITSHFQGLLDPAERPTPIKDILDIIEESDAQTEEEREEEEKARQKRQQSNQQRVQRTFKRFIKRYLRGISSQTFQTVAGYEVMTTNYVIFSHLLWKLFNHDWLDHQFIIETQLEIWQLYWGDDARAGYFSQLPTEEQAEAWQIIAEYHGEAQLLATLFFNGRSTRTERWHDTRLSLRNWWRCLLTQSPFTITGNILETTWIIVADLIAYEPPRPTAIIQELNRLANFDMPRSFLRSLENAHQFPAGACRFAKVTIRQSRNDEPIERTVTQLAIGRFTTEPSYELAKQLLGDWIRYEEKEYYRIAFVGNDSKIRVLYFDVVTKDGVFWNEATTTDTEFKTAQRRAAAWDDPLRTLQQLAHDVDLAMTLPSQRQIEVERHNNTPFDPFRHAGRQL